METCPKCGKESNKLIAFKEEACCGRCCNDFVNKRQLAFIIDIGFCYAGTYLGCLIIGVLVSLLSIRISDADSTNIARTIYLLFFIFRDAFQGRSLGKRGLGFQVVDIKTGQPAGPLQSFLRNILFIIPLVTLISAFTLKREQRLGEEWAGTKVILFRNANKKLGMESK